MDIPNEEVKWDTLSFAEAAFAQRCKLFAKMTVPDDVQEEGVYVATLGFLLIDLCEHDKLQKIISSWTRTCVDELEDLCFQAVQKGLPMQGKTFWGIVEKEGELKGLLRDDQDDDSWKLVEKKTRRSLRRSRNRNISRV